MTNNTVLRTESNFRKQSNLAKANIYEMLRFEVSAGFHRELKELFNCWLIQLRIEHKREDVIGEVTQI